MKIKLNTVFVLLTILSFSFRLTAQDPIIDSLKLALKNAKHDTTRCNILNELIEAESDDNIWPTYNEQLLKLAKKNTITTNKKNKIFYLKYFASALNNMGFIYDNQGDIKKALEYYNKSIKIQEEINDTRGIAASLNNIGFIYDNQGDIPNALECFHKSLKLLEKIKDKIGIATSLNNLGFIYQNQGDYAKAVDYYQKSLKIREEINDKMGIAYSLSNIGVIYGYQGDPSVISSKKEAVIAGQVKALDYYQKSLKLYEEIKYKQGIAQSLSNIGAVYNFYGDPSDNSSKENSIKTGRLKALKYHFRSLKIREEINDKLGVTRSFNNIAGIKIKQGDLGEAFNFANRSLQFAKELGYPDCIMKSAITLKSIYKKQNKFKDALEMYELEIQMRDSLNNETTKKASIQKQFQYEYEKKAAADSVMFAKENEIKEVEIARQKAEIKVKQNQQLALYGGLFLVLVFAGFMYNRFKVTQKQKTVIEQQKTTVEKAHLLLEEKNSEIIASIRYAKRIQDALMTSQKYMERNIDRLKQASTKK